MARACELRQVAGVCGRHVAGHWKSQQQTTVRHRTLVKRGRLQVCAGDRQQSAGVCQGNATGCWPFLVSWVRLPSHLATGGTLSVHVSKRRQPAGTHPRQVAHRRRMPESGIWPPHVLATAGRLTAHIDVSPQVTGPHWRIAAVGGMHRRQMAGRWCAPATDSRLLACAANKLHVTSPRRLVMAGCIHTLGSGGRSSACAGAMRQAASAHR